MSQPKPIIAMAISTSIVRGRQCGGGGPRSGPRSDILPDCSFYVLGVLSLTTGFEHPSQTKRRSVNLPRTKPCSLHPHPRNRIGIASLRGNCDPSRVSRGLPGFDSNVSVFPADACITGAAGGGGSFVPIGAATGHPSAVGLAKRAGG